MTTPAPLHEAGHVEAPAAPTDAAASTDLVVSDAEVLAEPESLTSADVGFDPEAPLVSKVSIDPEIIDAVDALGMLWGAYQLYPRPDEQPIFRRALDKFRDLTGYPFRVEVASAGFLTSDRSPIESHRDMTARLARQLFVHEIAAVEFLDPPSRAEAQTLLGIVCRDDDTLDEEGGLAEVTFRTGIESIQLLGRAKLVEVPDDWEADQAERPNVVRRFDPEDFATRLVAAAGGDPGEILEDFVTHYREAFNEVEAEDLKAREEVVRAHVDAYFYLPVDRQAPMLGELLKERDSIHVQALLDQFSGHELARLAPELDEAARAELEEYARLATDVDGRPDEILQLLQTSNEVKAARKAVSERVTELLGDDTDEYRFGEAFANLRTQIPQRDTDPAAARHVLRMLLSIEDQEPRLRRSLRIWTGRIATAVRIGDLEEAEAWLRIVVDDPTFDLKFAPLVEESLEYLASDDILDALLSEIAQRDDESAERLLGLWGSAVVEGLVERLAEEEDAARRRVLIDLLAQTARPSPEMLVRYLEDERWYVVRNLAVILGKIGTSDAAAPLHRLRGHPDHRVRSEALRSLVKVDPLRAPATLVEALSDDHERVREGSLVLLRTVHDPDVDRVLIEALKSRELSIAMRERLVGILVRVDSEDARAEIERLARVKLAIRNSTRRLRAAAVTAMEGQ